MRELTKNESRAVIGAINTTINMLKDCLSKGDSANDAIEVLEGARAKIESSSGFEISKVKTIKLVDWLECCCCGDSPLLVLSEFDDASESYCYDGDIVKCPICDEKGFIIAYDGVAEVCWCEY